MAEKEKDQEKDKKPKGAAAPTKEQLEAQRADVAARELVLRTEEARLERKRRELKIGVSRELQKEVEHARNEIREIVQEVKSAPVDTTIVQEARKKLGMKKQEAEKSEAALRAEAESTVPIDRTIRAGDLVRILDSTASGQVESVNQESVVVLCGNFRLTTSLKNLEKTSKKQVKKILKEPAPRQQKSSWSATTSAVESTTVDLRGLSGDEAIIEIDRFIDTMLLNRMHSAMILHGKGTGSLRQRTAEFLQQHKAVKSFRLGEWGEGGAGVTVVELE